MTNEQTVELLPCPFCGGGAVITYWNGGWPDSCYSVQCKDWKCPGKTNSGSERMIAEAWNTRATMQPALVEAERDTVWNEAIEAAATEMDTAAHTMSHYGSYAELRCYRNAAKAVRALKKGDTP